MITSGLWLKVDASRRRNDPRKRGKAPVSMVRLRGKPSRGICPERSSSGGHMPRSEPSSWRVWGQRPGQPKFGITKIILQIFFRINFQRVIFNIFPRAFPFCLVADYMVIKTALPKRFLRFSRHFKKPLSGVRLQSSNNIGKR